MGKDRAGGKSKAEEKTYETKEEWAKKRRRDKQLRKKWVQIIEEK